MGLVWQGEIEGTTRVLVACKSRLVAEALMFTLDSDPELEAVGYGLDGWEALDLVATYEPDVVVVAPELSGLESAAFACWMQMAFPEIHVVQLREAAADHEDGSAADCLTTSCSADELLHAIGEAGRRNPARSYGLRRSVETPRLRLVPAGALCG
jgi:DNA-binding NarL/FixJ family response regulator